MSDTFPEYGRVMIPLHEIKRRSEKNNTARISLLLIQKLLGVRSIATLPPHLRFFLDPVHFMHHDLLYNFMWGCLQVERVLLREFALTKYLVRPEVREFVTAYLDQHGEWPHHFSLFHSAEDGPHHAYLTFMRNREELGAQRDASDMEDEGGANGGMKRKLKPKAGKHGSASKAAKPATSSGGGGGGGAGGGVKRKLKPKAGKHGSASKAAKAATSNSTSGASRRRPSGCACSLRRPPP
jgi:hypothetical protein